ncbi:MAG: hypothetical protein DYH08_14595 [Actinobacteria bacterium ATB1]|nr:hypothetical protein [Actinobacteria bacterium ATB1]
MLVVDAVGRRLLRHSPELRGLALGDICVSSDPWLLAADVRTAVDSGRRKFVCLGGDEAWLSVAAGSAGAEGIEVGHAGGPASVPRNYGLSSQPERNIPRLGRASRQLLALDTILVTPEGGAEVEVANGVWTGFGRRAGLWARALGSWTAGLMVGGTSLGRQDVVLEMGSVRREAFASGVYVANGQFLGGLSFVPAAHPGDGKLDVLVFEGTAQDIWRVVPRLGTGSHLPHPRIRELHPRHLRIVGRGRLLADGHDIGRLPARLEVCPARLSLVV